MAVIVGSFQREWDEQNEMKGTLEYTKLKRAKFAPGVVSFISNLALSEMGASGNAILR